MKGGCGQDMCTAPQMGGNFLGKTQRILRKSVQKTQNFLRKSSQKSQRIIKIAANKSQNFLRKSSQKSKRVVRKGTQKIKRVARKGAMYTISTLGKIMTKAKKILRKTRGGACGCNKK